MHTNPVLDRLGSYPIAELQEQARAMRTAGLPLIDFSVGDPREPTPAFIPRSLKDSVPVVSQYPTTSGLPELRRAVADYVHRRFGVRVDPDRNVLPTAGSKEAIFSTPLAFVDRDARDAVVWATPGYPIYERGALLAGAEGHSVTPDDLFVAFSSAMADRLLVWNNGDGFGKIRAAWLDRAAGIGGTIHVRLPQTTLEGVFAGLDTDGQLILRQGSAERTISAGELFFGGAEAENAL